MIFPAILFTSIIAGCSGIKNASTAEVKVNGNCDMCEAAIEKAAFVKGESQADWDVNAKTARVTYDSVHTNLDAVLQRIAHAGYDNDRFLAPAEAYAALDGCCKYERTDKPVAFVADAEENEHHHVMGHAHAHNEAAVVDTAMTPAPMHAQDDRFKGLWTAYFALKDALVASDAAAAKEHAEELDGAMHSIVAESLPKGIQDTWPQVMKSVMPALHPLSDSDDLEEQRGLFAKLTAPMGQLAKAAPLDVPVYLDHCPMYEGGADWLSREKAIKNPFYGSQMLTCGSVKETIQ